MTPEGAAGKETMNRGGQVSGCLSRMGNGDSEEEPGIKGAGAHSRLSVH